MTPKKLTEADVRAAVDGTGSFVQAAERSGVARMSKREPPLRFCRTCGSPTRSSGFDSYVSCKCDFSPGFVVKADERAAAELLAGRGFSVRLSRHGRSRRWEPGAVRGRVAESVHPRDLARRIRRYLESTEASPREQLLREALPYVEAGRDDWVPAL